MSRVQYTVEQLKKLGLVQVNNGPYQPIEKLVDKKPNKLPLLQPKNDTFLLPTGAYIDVLYRFDIDPCPAPRMTQKDKWLKPRRKPVERYFNWRNEFVLLCKEVGYNLTPVLDILFIIPFPKSYNKKKRDSLIGQQHQIRPDRDNFLKSVQDSFSVDDGFVWDGRTIKIWGEKGQIIIF